MDREPASPSGILITTVPAPDRRRSGPALLYALAGLLLLGFAAAGVLGRGGVRLQPGWSAKGVHGSYVVSEVSKAGSALETGDRLLSVAGDDDAGTYGPSLALACVPPGSNYEVTVQRGGQVLRVSMQMPAGAPEWTACVPSLTVAVLLYVLAAWIAALKWESATGRLAAANFSVQSLLALAAALVLYPGWNRASAGLAFILISIWRPWPLAVGFDFLSRFPRPLSQPAVFRAARWVFYAAAALLWFPLNLHVLLHVLGVRPNVLTRALVPFQVDAEPGALIMVSLEIAAGILGCAVLVRNYLRLPDSDSRRRIRWAGLSFASVSVVFVFFTVTKTIAYLTGSPAMSTVSGIANEMGTVVVGISPIALAYAVVKHRVLGIRVVFRLGLQYLFAKTVLTLVILLPLLIVLLEWFANPGHSLVGLILHGSWWFYLVVAVTGAVSLRFRRSMYAWLDRRFFRAAHNQEQILLALIERLKSAESEEEVALAVAYDLDRAFHPDGAAILLRSPGGGSLHLAYADITDRAARLRDWLNTDPAGSLGSGSIFTLYEGQDANAVVEAAPDRYRQALVIPLTGTASNLGALVLGEKRSEEPYGGRDRDLLKAIAAQMAIMYEFLHLKERVADAQRVRVEVLGRLDNERIQLLSECPDCGRCYTSAEERCAEDGARLSLTLPVERTIEGKYQLRRRIGRGAMGVVYEAVDTRLNRQVALKVMLSHLFGNTGAVARFEREARAAALLQHPNIIRVYDFGHLGTGGAYFVMELIRGRSWREHLCEPGGIPAERVAAWIAQLCSAVSAAHTAGIIHRDLKPENLMITEGEEGAGRVVVLDFGLAKIRAEFSRLDRDATIAGAVMGTRGYMSSEQRSGAAVDARTDIYSVAVICAETITGKRPPGSGTTSDWMEPALTRVLGAGSHLARILEKAAAERAEERYASMGAFQEELSPALTEFTSRCAPGSWIAKATNADTLTFGPDDDARR
ncbi:MAG TPA: protein kinase [Candidatus Acidoferrales bacterium]|nr:protein kinase [Candidatus Acidoferrales bacterium]